MAVEYTSDEQIAFLQIVAKYPIIEEKRTDANAIEKKEAWANISIEFNAKSNVKRTITELKRHWERVKRDRKIVLANEWRELLATGDGEAVPVPPMEVEIEDHFEIDNIYDSDGIFMNQNLGEVAEVAETISPDSKNKGTDAASGSSGISSKRAKKRQLGPLEAITKARLELIEREKEQIVELHSLRMEEAQYRRDAAKLLLQQEQEKLRKLRNLRK
ncbi:unnamed protein product [Phyllotreta striolata]|uniref:Regulatory protein zeste n=1 Tax=Phyllotreta striolata TaxID=444603 RepID=A0A9N9XPM3_PHYSR|nr:unnamed protein product [Phyllotreta striolata]